MKHLFDSLQTWLLVRKPKKNPTPQTHLNIGYSDKEPVRESNTAVSNVTLQIPVTGSSVNLGSLGLGTITHPLLSNLQQSTVCKVERNAAFLQQSYCIRNINRASFKGVRLHIESIPTSIRLDEFTKVTLR